eukprot:gene12936-biopygen23009
MPQTTTSTPQTATPCSHSCHTQQGGCKGGGWLAGWLPAILQEPSGLGGGAGSQGRGVTGSAVSPTLRSRCSLASRARHLLWKDRDPTAPKECWEKRQRTRTGRGPDAGRTIEFEGTDADRTRAGRGRG